jgi:glycosyltransferase involved in cell wall biosynthesis
MDDHSTDNTVELAKAEGAEVFSSPFEGLDERRDKNWLYSIICDHQPDWILAIDGDEELEPSSIPNIRTAVSNGNIAYSLRIRYLWDQEDRVRVDGVYRHFHRPSLFKLINSSFKFLSTPWGGNLHCSSIPQELLHKCVPLEATLWHYGYLYAQDRARKFEWYNRVDPHNEGEDFYRHITQGDPGGEPAGIRLKHAGPVEFERR